MQGTYNWPSVLLFNLFMTISVISSGLDVKDILINDEDGMQAELVVKNVELAMASKEAEKLLKDISENTAIAEVEKGKVAVIVHQVSVTAAVRLSDGLQHSLVTVVNTSLLASSSSFHLLRYCVGHTQKFKESIVIESCQHQAGGKLHAATSHVTVIIESRCYTDLQEIASVKNDAEKDLAAAKPALDAALSALNSITSKDITALKALKNPPDIVKRIFDCVLLLR